MIYLIAGLGNPDKKYDLTRHNTGFMGIDSVIDSIIEDFGTEIDIKNDTKNKVITGKTSVKGKTLIFAKPTSYMNLSGGPIRFLMDFYKIPLENIIIIHDELDLPTGEIKVKKGGGNAGHNGLKDITLKCGNDYNRIRIGINHPKKIAGLENMNVADYVLGKFTKSEEEVLKTETFPRLKAELYKLLNL